MCLAIPGQVVEITDASRRLASVEVAGVRRVVNVGLLDGEVGASGEGAGVRPGDWVLVHVGFAMSRIDEREAAATLELLREMGSEFESELDEFEGSQIR